MNERVFNTSLGKVSGKTAGGVTRISRLRYARAPINDLRFVLPQPVAPWDGVLDATGPSPVAPQARSRLAAVMGEYPAEQSEDCLHLDIWIPDGQTEMLPVLVFLHGGAFMTGGGGLSCYDGTKLARNGGIIVVNVSYRLGALGFLAIEGIAPANLGLHDQIAALRFIRQEIGAFGGNAANITAAGQSAGAFSVAAMLSTMPANDLFDRAIMMSTPLGRPIKPTSETSALSAVFTQALGLADGDLKAAQSLPVSAILEAQGAVLRSSVDPAAPDNTTPPFYPSIDGDLLTRAPSIALFEGAGAWCPVVIGATSEETAAFYFQNAAVHAAAPDLLDARYEELNSGNGSQALAQARLSRPGATPMELLIDLWSKHAFIEPTMKFSRGHVAAAGEVYTYMFDWQSPKPDIAACHCIELPFLFGNLDVWQDAPMIAGARAEELAGLSAAFQNSLVAFVREGDPAFADGPAWPGFGTAGTVRHFDRRVRCSVDVPLW